MSLTVSSVSYLAFFPQVAGHTLVDRGTGDGGGIAERYCQLSVSFYLSMREIHT